MMKFIKKIILLTLILLFSIQKNLNISYADELSDLNQEWKSVGQNISPLQVYIEENGNIYMLPTYVNIKNLGGSLVNGCNILNQESESTINNRPNGAYRINCTNNDTFKNLLKSLQITTSHTIYGRDLPDLYIPKYFILERETKVNGVSKINIDNNGRIWYTNTDSYSLIRIFDPDFGNDNNDNNGTFEKMLYTQSTFTPNTAIEVFGLDGDRLSPETLNMGAYSIEHYLTSDEIDKTYDSSQLFGLGNNTLKYVLNYFGEKMEEKSFREICNKNNLTDLYKNDTIGNSTNIRFRYYLVGDPSSDRKSRVDNGECGGVTGLRTTSPINNNYMTENGSIKVKYNGTEVAKIFRYRSNNNWNNSTKSGGETYLVNIDKNMKDGDWIDIQVPNIGVIGHKRNFSTNNNEDIKNFLNKKKVKLYYLIKMTAYFPNGNDLYNKYTSGLDPMNNDWYNYNNHSGEEPLKYLYAYHEKKFSGGRQGSGDGNYFIMLGVKRGGDIDNRSTIYELSAPGYVGKDLSNNEAFNVRLKNFHLNISQGYMETERTGKSDFGPDLTLLSPVHSIPDEAGNTIHHIFRNYDADMEERPANNTDNMEQNLNYVLAYISKSSKLAFARNSFSPDGLLNGRTSEPDKFWYSQSLFNQLNTFSGQDACFNDIKDSTFSAGLYALYNTFNNSCPLKFNGRTTSCNFSGNNFYQQFESGIKKEPGGSLTSDGLLLQAITNAGDTEVYNQIYVNTNFAVGLPNKEPIKCKIDLYKVPVNSQIDYDNLFNSKADLTTHNLYSTPTNLFTNNPASYIDTDTLNSLLGKNYSRQLEINYGNKFYRNSFGTTQEWLYGEKGFVVYKCMKNNNEVDNIGVSIITSDKKYKKSDGKFIEEPSSNKLSGPLFSFNTGSFLGFKYTNSFEIQSVNNSNCGNGYNDSYIQTSSVGGFNYIKLNEEQEPNNSGKCQITKKTDKIGLFRGGIELQTKTQTTFGTNKYYGKIDIIIYDKNRPGQIIDQKSYYITVTKKDSLVISANASEAKWKSDTNRNVINHSSGITFTIQNNSTTTINANNTASGGLNIAILPIQTAKKANSSFINNGPGLNGAIAACNEDNVNCGSLTGYTNTTNGTKTNSQNGTAYLSGVLSSSNSASPKISIAIKNRSGSIINNQVIYQQTPNDTKIAYAIGTIGTPETEYFLKIFFPKNYSKLQPGDKMEITLKANSGAFVNFPWMMPGKDDEVGQATAFAVLALDGNSPLPGVTYSNYKPVIKKVVSENIDTNSSCYKEFGECNSTTNPKCIWSSGDGRKLYLSEERIRVVTGKQDAKCGDNINGIIRECIIKLDPKVYAGNIAEQTGYAVPTNGLTNVPTNGKYNFFVGLQYKLRNFRAGTGYQYEPSKILPRSFETVYPLKGQPKIVFNGISGIEKKKILKMTQDKTKAMGLSQATNSGTVWHSGFGDNPVLTAASQTGLTSGNPTQTGSIFKYPFFCDGVNIGTGCTNRGDIANTIYYGVKGTSNGEPSATAYMVFSNENSNNVNGVDLRGQICKIGSINFPSAPPARPAHGYCNVLSQEVPNGSNNINICDPNASGVATSNSISLEEDKIPGNYIKYKIECGNDGDEDFEGDLTFNISNYSNYATRASYTISNGGQPEISSTANSVKLSGITIPGNSVSQIELKVYLKTRTPQCPDTLPEMVASAKLESSSYQSDLPDISNSVSFKECKVPTLNLNDVKVSDGNSDNDKTENYYTSAYPFEFSQCGNRLRYEIEGTYECYDSNSAKINVSFDVGNKIDGKGQGRDPVASLTASNLYSVTPTIQGTNSVYWNMGAYIHNGSPSGSFSPYVSIIPTSGGDFKMENSKFTITNVGSPNTKIKSPTGKFTQINSTTWVSPSMNMQIGLDPVVSNQKIYDNGIYADANDDTVKLHKEEIDGTSKKETKTGTGHYEPIIFEAKVENPSKNETVYGMKPLMFDFSLNPNTSSYFDKVDTTVPSSGDNIYVRNGEPLWLNQTLSPGNSINYKGGFNVVPTLRTPHGTPPNNLYQANGRPSLKFANDQGIACNFNEGFRNWSSEILKNPITISSISFNDETPTQARNEITGESFEQHLPGDTISINVGFDNNNSTRDFNNVFVKFTFDPTGSGKIDDSEVEFDFNKLFNIKGTEGGGWVTLEDNSAKCKTTKNTLTCQLLNTLNHESSKTLKIPLLINIENQFYQKLKQVNNTKNWKYWYPVVISKIEYGTPDLNLVNNVVYYTSGEDEIPSGGRRDDIENNDFNDPINRIIEPEPKDGKYSFYIGIPYARITTTYQNASVGNISPGDILLYKTKITNIGKALLKNPNIIQNMFRLGLKQDWVDVEVNKVRYIPTFNKTNISETTIDFYSMNNDSDITNNVDVKNIGIVEFKEGFNNNNFEISTGNKITVKPNQENVLIDGSNSLNNGGELELITEIKILKLKDSQKPQIDCKTSDNCIRPNKNPKKENVNGKLDIPYVGSSIDEESAQDYYVYFPILKSVLFAKSGIDYKYIDGSNSEIKGMLNSDNTTVTYRIDNFVPQEYTNHITEGIGKARNLKTYIRLPMGVRYVPGSVKRIDNILDGVNEPGYNVATPVSTEPIIREHTDYGVSTLNGTHSFDNSFLNGSSEWHKIEGSNDNHFRYMKGTPFKFNFFNKSYNYYRVTDDGALALGYSLNPGDPVSLNESQYYIDKRNGILHTIGPATIHFNRIKQGLKIPSGTRYVNEKGEYKISDGINPVTVQKDSSIFLGSGSSIIFTESGGLDGVSFSGSNVDIFKSNVDYDTNATQWKNYAIISPAFVKLDMTRKPEHGIYEKIVRNGSGGTVTEIWYQWYGYVEGTNKEVKFGVILYNGSRYNNIKFTYGEIDNTLNVPVISGISSGRGNIPGTYAFGPYNGLTLRDLSNKEDVEFDASPANVYQELIFNIGGYRAESIDAVQDPLLMYQEKSASGAFVKGPGKDNTAYIFQFNVRISTSDIVCGKEYTVSDGGDTLSWGRINSQRSDRDDIDQFCFSALKPIIKILDNGSYSRGGYKTSANNCTVNHLSLMGFNARAIGWNSSSSTPGCWLTYSIKDVKKDLSINSTSPYDLLAKFKNKTDTRPVDTSLTMNNKKLVLTLAKDIKIKTSTGNIVDINDYIPGFNAIGFKILSKSVFYLYGNDSNNGYFLRSSNEGDHYDILYKSTGRKIVKAYISDMLNLIFFNDGKFVRETNGGAGPWSNIMTLVDYNGINDIGFLSSSNGFVLGNNGILWKTQDGGQSFEKINLRTLNNLGLNENLTSIDIYGGRDLWIATSLGNVLYSSNGGRSFVKKTSGASIDTKIFDYEDGRQTAINVGVTDIAGNSMQNVDTSENGASIKFDNFNFMLTGKGQKSISTIIPADGTILNYSDNNVINLSPYITNNHINGDLYLDIYISDINKTQEPGDLILKDNGGTTQLKIFNIKQFNIDGSNTLKTGWNTIKVPIRTSNNPGKWSHNGSNWNNIKHIQLWNDSSRNRNMQGSYFVISNLRLAPISNLSNIQTVSLFPNGNISKINQTEILRFDSNTNPNNRFSLSAFKKSDNTLDGYLTLDIYVSDTTGEFPYSMTLGNSNGNGIRWNNLISFIKGGTLKTGWNTLVLPFNENGNSNIIYTNKYDINWNTLDLLKMFVTNTTHSRYTLFAIDNLTYSSTANTSFNFIRFFNTTEGVAYDQNKTYITSDNITWGNNEVHTETGFSFVNIIKLKGRELYGIANSSDGWVSYYSLDKGKNSKKFSSMSGINFKAFDVYDYDYGFGVSSNNKLYKMELVDG